MANIRIFWEKYFFSSFDYSFISFSFHFGSSNIVASELWPMLRELSFDELAVGVDLENNATDTFVRSDLDRPTRRFRF